MSKPKVTLDNLIDGTIQLVDLSDKDRVTLYEEFEASDRETLPGTLLKELYTWATPAAPVTAESESSNGTDSD